MQTFETKLSRKRKERNKKILSDYQRNIASGKVLSKMELLHHLADKYYVSVATIYNVLNHESN